MCVETCGAMWAQGRWVAVLTHSLLLPKLRKLLLESQSQLQVAQSEAQKQSDELALVGGHVIPCHRLWGGGAAVRCVGGAATGSSWGGIVEEALPWEPMLLVSPLPGSRVTGFP